MFAFVEPEPEEGPEGLVIPEPEPVRPDGDGVISDFPPVADPASLPVTNPEPAPVVPEPGPVIPERTQ